MDRNQQVLAAAFKKAKRKLKKISELGVTANFTDDQVVELTRTLAEAKAIEDGVDMREHLDGQEWYVRSLVEAAGMSAQEVLDKEYDDSFADIAEEDDMIEALDALIS